MKHLFKIPQKKGKNYISNSQEKILLEVSEIKIKNLKQLADNNGYYLDIIVPVKNNKDTIKVINDLDCDAKKYLGDNVDEDINFDINDIYVNSYDKDESSMTVILSNKIETEIFINEEEKTTNEMINFLGANKKNKNLIVNLDIIFLGIYINKDSIINKWAVKYISIEDLDISDNSSVSGWNRAEIEEEWGYDLLSYEEEVNNRIAKLKNGLNNAKTLYTEIIHENNLKIWENKIDKLKNNILSIYDNR
jgi:hypothetical protein